MKKLLATVVSLLFLANASYAQFAMPKISVHKKEAKPVETPAPTKQVSTKTETPKAKLYLPTIKKDKAQTPKTEAVQPKAEKRPKQPIKIFTKQKETTKTEEIKPPKGDVKTSNKFSFIKKEKNETKQIKETQQKQQTKHINLFSKKSKEVMQEPVTTTEDITPLKKNKISIKNPFKKKQLEVGEDLVSKEQIKEELTRVHNLSQQAVALYTDNNLDDSLNTFLKIPEKYRSAQDYVLMGNILSDLGRREDAIFMYKRAILTDEFNYKAYYNIGNICLNDDKYFMAIDYYKKAKKYASDFPYVYYNLGCAYIKAGDLKKAKSNLTKAIELKNTEPDFHYNLAYVYKKLDKPKLAKVYLENYNKLTNGQ